MKHSEKAVRAARPPGEPPKNATHLLGPFPNDPIYGITPNARAAPAQEKEISQSDYFFASSSPYKSFYCINCFSSKESDMLTLVDS